MPVPQRQPPALLTRNEAAAALGCSRSQVTALIEEGRLAAFDLRAKSSRACLRIPAGAVLAYQKAPRQPDSVGFRASP